MVSRVWRCRLSAVWCDCVEGKQSWGGLFFATNSDLSEGLSGTSRTCNRWVQWKIRRGWFKSWLRRSLGPQGSPCSFLGPSRSQRSTWMAWEGALRTGSCSKDGEVLRGEIVRRSGCWAPWNLLGCLPHDVEFASKFQKDNLNKLSK